MNFICFDTEDNSKELLSSGKSGFDKTVTQIAAKTANGNTFYNTGDVKQFLKWLQQQKEQYIYAHNLQYDLGNLFGYELDTLDCTLVGGRLIKAIWGKKTFVDSFNIWPMAAKKLGEAFDLQKLETASMATDKDYVMRDVEIIRQAMLFAWEFTNCLGIKNLPPTLGGLCVKIWKAWGGINCHDSTLLSKDAMFGGRVELFKMCDDSTYAFHGHTETVDGHSLKHSKLIEHSNTEKSVCLTDINSLYPSVMRNEFPDSLEDYGKQLPDYGVARIDIQVPESEIVVLPFRNEDGRILYPYGKFTGTWCIPEIMEAVAQGAKILKVRGAMGSSGCSKPYFDFVVKLYEARLTSKTGAEKLFFKLLMNNLYGRLGTSGVIGRTVWQTDTNKSDGVPFGDKVLVNYTMPLPEETNWSHAAYVTCYGRLALFKHLKLVGAERLIYCDTDSCVFDSPDKTIPFQVGSDLGKMKLEGWNDAAITYAPKLYRIGKTFKAKGVPARLAKEFLTNGHAHFDLPFKFREAVAYYDRKNSKRLSVWRQVEKMKRSSYDRKKLQGNKFFPCKVNAIE